MTWYIMPVIVEWSRSRSAFHSILPSSFISFVPIYHSPVHAPACMWCCARNGVVSVAAPLSARLLRKAHAGVVPTGNRSPSSPAHMRQARMRRAGLIQPTLATKGLVTT